MPENLVEGWTEPIRQILIADGTAINGTGLGIELVLRDRTSAIVATGGKVTWHDDANGIAKYTPVSGDIKAENSPYEARWKVTSGGEISFFPNGKADAWTVRK